MLYYTYVKRLMMCVVVFSVQSADGLRIVDAKDKADLYEKKHSSKF